MVSRCPAQHRAPRSSQLPRVATLSLAAAVVAPLATAVPAMAAPVGAPGALPASPFGTLPATPFGTLPATPLPTTPLPATPVSTTPLPATPLPATPLPATPAPDTVTRYVTAAANVRSGPGTGHAVVGGLAKDARVTGTMTSNGWFRMSSNRFVAGNLLTATPPGQDTPPSDTVTRWTTTGVNVRSGPGLNHAIVGGLAKDSRVTGTMTANGWLDMGSGRFVSGSLLTATDPGGGGSQPAPPPVTPPGDTVTRYVTVTANVRSGPGTHHGVVGTVAQGTQVNGTYTANGWLDMGSSRFVSGTLLSTTPPGSQPAPPPAPGTVTGAMILAEVAKYNGVPYLWGGSTPAGFDCSGLTWYTFNQLGISLPRTAAQQRNATPYVNDPRPGDLIFFGSPAYHVGIYAGNGMLWDAGRPGVPVQLRAVWNSGDISYGRVPGTTA